MVDYGVFLSSSSTYFKLESITHSRLIKCSNGRSNCLSLQKLLNAIRTKDEISGIWLVANCLNVLCQSTLEAM